MPIPFNKWLPLRDFHINLEGRWESSAQIGSSSEWFSGHFEGCPLLPGVALLALAAETVKRQAQEQGRLLEVSGFLGVRFRRFVFPDEKLLISVAGMPPGAKGNLDFQITCQGETVAQGVLIASQKAPRE